jgi:hypothetical protein
MAKRTSLDHLNDDEKYLIALGLFVEKFAACESMLIVALARLTRCDDPTSRAIFSGVRSDTARSHIRRILEARGEPMPEFLESSFQQLGIISTLRNDLMHYGAYAVGQNPDERTVSNEVAAMPGRERVTPISAEILTDLIGDVETITAAIGLFHLTYHGVPPELVPDWCRAAAQPWRYRLPKQGRTHRDRRDGPKPKRRRKSSGK